VRKACTSRSSSLCSDPATRARNRSLPLCGRYQGYPVEKKGSTGYDNYNKINVSKLSALVNRNRLPLACMVALISIDAVYDAQEIRQYNRKRGIKSNIPVNRRARKHPKRERSFWFDLELYKKRSAVERFFSWIEAFKKIVPRYKLYKHSVLGLIHLTCGVMIRSILG